MDSDTDRDGGLDAYWRRRAIALGGALVSLGLLAWACSGSDGKKSQQIRNAAAIGTAGATAGRASGRASGRAANASPGVVLPTVTVTATAKVTVVPAVPKQAGDACDPADVVVNLAEAKDTFVGKEHPQFKLSVVNTGQLACTLGVGPKELEISVRSGSGPAWSSARCAAGSGSSIQLLQRGIPYVTGVEWDRTRSPAAGCSGHRERALPGTYRVIAREGRIRSNRQVFHLR
jgi:hypothetical protein